MTGIDVLHTFPLGVTTDVLVALENLQPTKMRKFLCETKQRKELGNQPGGKFRFVKLSSSLDDPGGNCMYIIS